MIGGRDWSSHPLGPPERWPHALRVALSLVLNSPESMILCWGPELFFFFNDTYFPMLGPRLSWAMGERFDRVWADGLEQAKPIIDDAMAGRSRRFVDMPWKLDADRGEANTWWTFSYSRVLDADGKTAGLFIFTNETTEHVRSAAALRESEARNRQILDSAIDFAIVATNLEGRVTRWNEGAHRILGWSETEMLGQTLHRFFTPEDLAEDRVEIEMRNALDTGRGNDERWHRRKDGQRFWAVGEMTVLRDEHRAAIGFVKVLRDRTEHQLAEEKRRIDAEFLASVLASSSDCIKVLDLDGNLTFMSEGGRLVMEVSDFAAIRGRPWPDFWEGEGRRRAQAALDAARAGGEGHFQGSASTMAGNARFWDVRVTPVPGADGLPEKLLAISRDITAAWQAEQALREVQSLNTLILGSSRDCIVVLDLEGHTLVVSPGGVEAMEISDVDAIIGLSWLRVWKGIDHDLAVAAVAAARDGGTGRFEGFCPTHKGTPKWWDVVISPLPGPDGRPERMVSVARDISQRRRAEQCLRELNDTLEQRVRDRTQERDRVWSSTNDLMGTAGFDGYLREINPAWERTLGWAEQILLSRPFVELIDPMDHTATADVLDRLSQGETVTAFVDHLKTSTGGLRTVMWDAVPDGDMFYIVGRDITQQRETEERLRQSQKMEAVGQLTGGLAHDFNNLLSGILGSLDLLSKRVAQGRIGELERYIIAAQGASRRAAALTHRLLAFSRRQTLDPKPIDVHKLVIGMADLIRRTVGPEITVETVDMAGLWTALVDPSQLENALLNLCINARDAMPDGGRITIETANKWMDDRTARERDLPPGQYLSLCVSDTGTGMTPEVIARAFDPFFTTKPLGQGTGLGLSMIYGFARQSGGQVRIYSEVGQGSMVCIYLPRHYGKGDIAGDDTGVERDLPRAIDGETVLVVDDEPTVRMLVADVLFDLGYAAIECEDGASGLKVLQGSGRVDLLITDVGLPGGMNGRQVADAARVLRPDLKVLFITGYAENAVVGNGHLDPGMAIMTKPFNMDDLASRIRGLIEG